MTVYLLLIIYEVILAIISSTIKGKDSKKGKILYLFLAFFPMIFVMGFRNISVGTDTRSYYNIFYYLSHLDMENLFKYNISKGWILLNYLFCHFGNNPINYVLPLSIITEFLFARFIYKNSINVRYSTLLYILSFSYFSAFNGARQYLAVGICLNSFNLLSENKINKYIIINILAFLIHPTSCIFLVTGLFYVIKFNKKNFWKICLIFLIFMILYIPFANILVKIDPHYSLYIDSNGLTNFGFKKGLNRFYLITIIYMLFEIFLYHKYKNNQVDAKYRDYHFILIILNFFTICLQTMALQTNMFSRMAWYFDIYNIIFVPYTFIYFSKKNSSVLKFLYIMMMFIPCYVQLSEGLSDLIPYKFL